MIILAGSSLQAKLSAGIPRFISSTVFFQINASIALYPLYKLCLLWEKFNWCKLSHDIYLSAPLIHAPPTRLCLRQSSGCRARKPTLS